MPDKNRIVMFFYWLRFKRYIKKLRSFFNQFSGVYTQLCKYKIVDHTSVNIGECQGEKVETKFKKKQMNSHWYLQL
jgi:hypothetical protein